MEHVRSQCSDELALFSFLSIIEDHLLILNKSRYWRRRQIHTSTTNIDNDGHHYGSRPSTMLWRTRFILISIYHLTPSYTKHELSTYADYTSYLHRRQIPTTMTTTMTDSPPQCSAACQIRLIFTSYHGITSYLTLNTIVLASTGADYLSTYRPWQTCLRLQFSSIPYVSIPRMRGMSNRGPWIIYWDLFGMARVFIDACGNVYLRIILRIRFGNWSYCNDYNYSKNIFEQSRKKYSSRFLFSFLNSFALFNIDSLSTSDIITFNITSCRLTLWDNYLTTMTIRIWKVFSRGG